MKVRIAKGKPNGTLMAPPSKSFAHRYLIAAALSCGEVSNLSYSDDVIASLSCLEKLGAKYIKEGNAVKFDGFAAVSSVPTLDCNESGSTLRFSIPIAMTMFDEVVFKGTEKLISRGIEAYEDSLAGVVSFGKSNDSILAKGRLVPGDYAIDASKSSQYVSGLLIALSLLKKDSSLTIKGELTSKPYVDITLDVLSKFGIVIEEEGGKYTIKGGQTFNQISIANEGDHSNAAFLDAFNHLGGCVEVSGLNPQSLQGDKVYKEHFDALSKGYATIDIENCIDLAPVLFSLASLKHGGHFINTRRLAVKESNRALAMKEELEKAGAILRVEQNEVIVIPRFVFSSNLEFNSHNDHRIAMALSLYSTESDIAINDAGCIDKSYPDYFKDLEKLGMEVQYDVTK